MTLQKSSNI